MMRLCVLALALLTSSSLRAEDWPEFRGPTGQGIVRKGGLPTAWGPQKNVVWKKALPGKGWSSPVVVSNRVYLTTAVPSQGGLSLRTLCLDAGFADSRKASSCCLSKLEETLEGDLHKLPFLLQNDLTSWLCFICRWTSLDFGNNPACSNASQA